MKHKMLFCRQGRVWKRRAGLLFFLFLGSSSLPSPAATLQAAETNIKIKILAVNPSTSPLKASVVQYLPSEIRPDDVLDPAGMEVKFDADKKSYYLSQEIELTPKETRQMEVVIKNIWMVDSAEIEEVKSQLQQTMQTLSGTKYGETAKLLYDKVAESLDAIEEAQSKPMGIRQRIDLYRVHAKQLDNIRKDGFSLEAMRLLEAEQKGGLRSVKFWLTAQNPSSEERKMDVRALLPKEVTRENILDKLDFALAYDAELMRYTLEKQDTFAAKEEKKYAITLRDVWYIPENELDFLRIETDKLSKVFEATPYSLYAKERTDFIYKALEDIIALQKEVQATPALEDRIRAYILNTQRKDLIKKKIREMQDLLPEVPLKASEDQFMKKNALQLLVRKIVNTKDLVLIAMGLQPNTPITWWIFFGIMAFLALLTSVFYVTWLKKLRENRWIQAPGAAQAKPSSKAVKTAVKI